jgi:hypothetical protein
MTKKCAEARLISRPSLRTSEEAGGPDGPFCLGWLFVVLGSELVSCSFWEKYFGFLLALGEVFCVVLNVAGLAIAVCFLEIPIVGLIKKF